MEPTGGDRRAGSPPRERPPRWRGGSLYGDSVEGAKRIEVVGLVRAGDVKGAADGRDLPFAKALCCLGDEAVDDRLRARGWLVGAVDVEACLRTVGARPSRASNGAWGERWAEVGRGWHETAC